MSIASPFRPGEDFRSRGVRGHISKTGELLLDKRKSSNLMFAIRVCASAKTPQELAAPQVSAASTGKWIFLYHSLEFPPEDFECFHQSR
jgi:hypothetical protein